jgi:hypothetical protein
MCPMFQFRGIPPVREAVYNSQQRSDKDLPRREPGPLHRGLGSSVASLPCQGLRGDAAPSQEEILTVSAVPQNTLNRDAKHADQCPVPKCSTSQNNSRGF